MSKLRWRCRRGLLENDLLIERLFARPGGVSRAESNGLYLLMELADNDLLDLFLGRQAPTGRLDRAEVHQVLEAVRRAPFASVPSTTLGHSSSPTPSRTPP
ncbi:MAG: succinate dehydrogenase assembly factor 2 [Pseudomonadota bacterium]|nr:succinate dehydrogenase assembly factor 2 [Pseudomonadota bacterium]